ncbi:AAA family ATPase [Lamprobacter modestohalophilus]|uniref:AAA family ATPase n=1 Tax=Lamprobacter modestohalophilus TaxID=1064514 RepID=UPI002ADEECD3|nr:AAA family ATPase [Lamprobacter modestohalophilus]MEA1052145.1 AAA family ATPase [Lamprobacter modestohalophilus]
MRIEEFEYQDYQREWRLDPVQFSDLTLLVGISGVGKTQILEALYNLKRIADGKSLNGIEWKVTFSTKDNRRYQWSGRFEKLDGLSTSTAGECLEDDREVAEKPIILYENLTLGEQQVIARTKDEIRLHGENTPKLTSTSSAINLLAEEDAIKPVREAFRRIILSDQSNSLFWYRGRILIRKMDKLSERYDSLEKVRESALDTMTKLALVYRNHPDQFKAIRERFLDIFPQVTDIKIEPLDDLDAPTLIADMPIIQIREQGVKNWIEQDKISSGMMRTIQHIAELFLWPDGTVILIDEFENSLGVNCIDIITEDLLHYHRRLQFILTSHHPYIINNIGPQYWKVVTRVGGHVQAHDAQGLGLGHSAHQAFIQLINSETYREGIAV